MIDVSKLKEAILTEIMRQSEDEGLYVGADDEDIVVVDGFLNHKRLAEAVLAAVEKAQEVG